MRSVGRSYKCDSQKHQHNISSVSGTFGRRPWNLASVVAMFIMSPLNIQPCAFLSRFVQFLLSCGSQCPTQSATLAEALRNLEDTSQWATTKANVFVVLPQGLMRVIKFNATR